MADYRSTKAVIDLGAIRRNTQRLIAAYPGYKYYTAVVKADCYGYRGFEVVDANGDPFTYDESFDPNSLIELKDEAVGAELESFVEEFLDAYVIFAGCANDSRYANYSNVIRYVVPESNLAKRMKEALDGLQYAQSRGDEVDTVTFHHLVQLSQEAYMCDVTYLVNTTGREGVVQTTTNVKMVLVRSGDKLLVESMIGY